LERAGAVKKVLEMLEAVKIDSTIIKEIEKLLAAITSDLEEVINGGELLDLRSLYHQQALVIKIQSALEDLHGAAEGLGRLKEELRRAFE